MTSGDAFSPLRSVLARAGIRYAVGGSWASTAYETLACFLDNLPNTFYVDPAEARTAIRLGRPFNMIYMPLAFKFDFFPARAFPLGMEELERAIVLSGSGLSEGPAPFVTPEDILLAKLFWFQAGGESSEVQWRDIQGIVRYRGGALDHAYLQQGAGKLGLRTLRDKAVGTA